MFLNKLYKIDYALKKLRNDYYNKNEDLFNGKHRKVFKIKDDAVYLPLNYSATIVKIEADGLAKNSPRYLVEGNQKENQVFIEELAFNSSLDVRNHEGAIQAGVLGDLYLLLDLGEVETIVSEDRTVDLSPQEIDMQITLVDARNVSIVSSLNNKNRVIAYIVDGIVETENGPRYIKRIYTKNDVIVEVYKTDGKVGIDSDDKFIQEESSIWNHGYGEFLLQHVPKFKTPFSLYGKSTFDDIMELQGALNYRVSSLIVVYNKHGQPRFLMSASLFDFLATQYEESEDDEGNRLINLDGQEVLRLPPPVNGGNEAKLEAVVWDAKENSVMELIKYLKDEMFLLSEISRQLVDGENSGNAASAAALRQLIIKTTNKIERLKKNFDLAKKKLFYVSQKIAVDYATNYSLKDAYKVDIQWKDMIDTSSLEIAQVTQMEQSTGLLDSKTILRKNYGYTEEQIDSILKAKEEENASPLNYQQTVNNPFKPTK